MATFLVRHSNRRRDNLFFSGMALLILAAVLVGFARTYFLAGIFRAPLPNLLIHIHGAVFTSWIILLIAQTSLVVAGRVDLHRRLGVLGFCLACLVFALGLLAATDGLVRGRAPATAVQARIFYAVPIADMIVFPLLIYFAFRNRTNPAAHKRYILIATITLLDAAFVRWPAHVPWWDLHIAEMCCFVLLPFIAGYDLWSSGRVQRATLWASVFVIAMQLLRHPIGHTAAWQSFAAWVQIHARI
ncbi:MAG TPA: hypothetical protein VGZ48_09020 [Candidatus Acidoferrales bacterium]|jgi:hypothetical protein|nr:hypothetical protein [Candidatus Acidoferrales bacterium]